MDNMLDICGIDYNNYTKALKNWQRKNIAGKRLGAFGVSYSNEAVAARDSLIKINGGEITGDLFSEHCNIVKVEDQNSMDIILKIYPNPFTNEITLDMEGEGEAEIRIFNATGRIVKTQSYNFGTAVLNTEDLKEGLHTLTVFQNGKRLIAKKVVK